MSSSLSWVDELVRELLLFRGFVATLKTFDAETRNEKEKAFRVDKLVDHVVHLTGSGDLQGLRDLWSHLNSRLFSRIEHRVQQQSAQRLEQACLKLYLVHCVQNKRLDRVREFFDKLGPELQNSDEWRDWFALPFVKEPENSSKFAPFFSRQWQDALLLSLHNLLSIVFAAMPTPRIVDVAGTVNGLRALREENETLRKALLKINKVVKDHRGDNALDEFKVPETKLPDELMDDFFVIAQQQQDVFGGPEAQGKKLKSFLKNITGSTGSTNSASIASSLGSATTNIDSNSSSKKIGGAGIRAKKVSNNDANSASTVSSGMVSASLVEQRVTAKLSHPPVKRVSRPSSSTSLASGDETRLLREDSTGSSRGSSKFLLLSQEEYREHDDAVHHCKFSPSGALVASADSVGVVKVWSPMPPAPNTVATFVNQNGAITCLEWLSSGPLVSSDSHLIYGSASGVVRLCEQQSRRTISELDLGNGGDGSRVSALAVNGSNVCALAVVKDSSKLVLADPNASMAITSTVTESVAEITSMCFNHNSQLITVGNVDGKVEIYDLRQRDCVSSFTASDSNNTLLTLKLSNDETSILTLDTDGLFSAWSMYQTGKNIFQQCIIDDQEEPQRLSSLVWGDKFALSGQDSQQAMVCNGKRANIFSVQDSGLDKLLSLRSHKQDVISCDWSPLHHHSTVTQTCLTSSTDGLIRVSTLLCQ